MEESEISRPASRLEELQYTDEPNKAMRKMLAERWKRLPEDKQISIRAARAKRGVKCPICGKIGYFMENCPNQCVSPPGTPDSWASSPPGSPPKSPVGLGVLWGDQCDKPPSPLRYDYKKKVDTGVTRPPAKKEEARLRDLDGKIGTFEFFAEAEEGHADSYAQMSLHQVMRRLMRLLERQLTKNTQELEASFDTTLLHPPFQKERATFYPAELGEIKEYRDYFLEKEKKKEHRKVYQNQSSVRCADELDPLFRGGNLSDDFLYKVNPRAGASMHSKNTWKSILSHSDDLASSDPIMAQKEAKLQALFRSQSKWIALQKRGMAQKNDRFEHLVHILKEEMKHEHEREYRGLQAGKHGAKATSMKIYQERLETVDKIMTCLHSYNFTSGLDEADFLFFCFDKWKQTLESKVYGKNLHRAPKYTRVDERTSHDHSNSKAAALKRSATGLTDASSVGQESQSTTAVADTSGPGLDYNRMISAANPYAKDLAFLDYMKKKHEAARIRAMAPMMSIADGKGNSSGCSTAGGGGGASASSGSTMRTPVLHKQHSQSQSQEGVTSATSSLDGTLGMSVDKSTVSHKVETSKESRPPLPRQVSFASSEGSSLVDSDFIYSDHSPSRDTSVPGRFDGAATEKQQQGQQLVVANKHGVEELDSVYSQASVSAESSIYDANSSAIGSSSQQRQQQLVTRRQGSRSTKNFTIKRRLHPRVVDEMNMEKAKGAFRRAGLKGHIRKGEDNDLAYLAPTLIPVPGAFQADGSNPMVSHTAENILFAVKKNMILGDIGYTPQTMVPLYARNTLMEKNGTTPGGDQNYLVMATDRRYSHYVGRPLNRFEPDEKKLKMTEEFNPINMEILKDSLSNPARQMKLMTSALAKTLATKESAPRGPSRRELQEMAELAKKEEAAKLHRQERRIIHEEMEKAKGLPLTKSLVRLAFKDPLPSLAGLAHLDD